MRTRVVENMALEGILPYLPILTVISFVITIALLVYKLGRWIEKLENSLNSISEKMDNVSHSIDKVPQQVWQKYIEATQILGMGRKGNPHKTRTEILFDKAMNKTISKEEALELRDMLVKEAQKAQKSGDVIELLMILGILMSLGFIMASLFKEK